MAPCAVRAVVRSGPLTKLSKWGESRTPGIHRRLKVLRVRDLEEGWIGQKLPTVGSDLLLTQRPLLFTLLLSIPSSFLACEEQKTISHPNILRPHTVHWKASVEEFKDHSHGGYIFVVLCTSLSIMPPPCVLAIKQKRKKAKKQLEIILKDRGKTVKQDGLQE